MNRWLLLPLCIVGLGALVLWFRSGSPERAGSSSLEENRWLVKRADRDRYLSDPRSVDRDLMLKPFPAGSKDSVEHLEIVEITEGSPLYLAGFRRGDQILKVNGTPIRTLSRAVNLIHEVGQATILTAVVRRQEKLLDYRFEFR